MAKNPFPERLSKRRAIKMIRKIAENSANVFFTYHAWDRMEEREISDRQVFKVLQTGTIFDGPEDSTLYDNWECGVKGFSAGENIRLRIGIERDLDGIIVITVYRVV